MTKRYKKRNEKKSNSRSNSELEIVPIDFKKHSRLVQVDGQEVYGVILKSNFFNKYVGYQLIIQDLDFCLHWLRYLDKAYSDPKITETLGITLALIVTYGKCFAQAEGRKVKLDRSDVSETNIEAHDRIISLRNNYVAHGGNAGDGAYWVYAFNPDSNNQRFIGFSGVRTTKTLNLAPETRNTIQSEILLLRELCVSRGEVHHDKHVQLVNSKPLNVYYEAFGDAENRASINYKKTLKCGFKLGSDALPYFRFEFSD